MNPKETLPYFQSLQPQMLTELLRWVEMESPTTDKRSIDRLGEVLATTLSEIGMRVEVDSQPVRGNHLIASWTGGKQPKILMIGHLDTVWGLDTLETMPVRVEGDIAYGPGIFDMKGGILIAVAALRLLDEQKHQCNITLLLTSDEEEGSTSSRTLIEREAKDAQCVFILEPAGPDNSLKTKRRGTGDYKIKVHGKSAHAGVEPAKGVNAIQELAHQVLEIQSWNQLREGIGAHVGIVHGGTRANVIPAEAEAVVDVRCDTMEDQEWLNHRFAGIISKNPLARIEITGGFERPPMVRTEQVLSLYREAAEIASAFDYPVREFWTGGGSDGNFTAALGVPTLDGMGPEGEGAHAVHEQIVISSLPKRANLLYHLIRRKI